MTFGQMDEQNERQTNRRRNRRTGGETDEQEERQMNRKRDRQTGMDNVIPI